MKKLKSYFPAQKVKIDCSVKPDDWLVWELGQSPAHCLWHCSMINMETKESVSVEEYDTAQLALEAAIKQIPTNNKANK